MAAQNTGTPNAPLKLFDTLFTALILSILLAASAATAQLPKKIKLDDEIQRERMIEISRHLGVNCAACHNLSNFASDNLATFKIAKDHIRITQMLIDSGMDGKNYRPKADCFMCHRGKVKPDYKEPFDPMTMEKIKKDKKKTHEKKITEEKDDEETKE